MSTTTPGIAGRADALLGLFDGPGIDLLLVSELVNVRYLTGYTGSNGIALIGPDKLAFVTDFRYVEQAAAEVDQRFERFHTAGAVDLTKKLPELLGSAPLRLGFDEEHTSVGAHRRLAELLGPQVTLVPAGGLVEELRRRKDAEEIAAIAAAQQLADAAFEALVSKPIIGRTERELALELEQDMRLRGASAPSFDSIIAGGPHGALPHASPRDVAIESGQLVVIDWGAMLDGYASDCTRTVAAGEISDRARDAYELVLRAQVSALDAVRPGADCNAVDKVARDIITAAGHGEHFGHGLGHGVGLEVHESPTLSLRVAPGADKLAVDDIVTVEPGVYLPGEFGIRIEDLVVVTDGAPRVLTSVPKALRVVD
ncbi:MAG: aminopeptidase P family protein [Solirubrobacterales bacterium]|nr:aminopeptidase P family protein [Solirubrobacterales bacterium]